MDVKLIKQSNALISPVFCKILNLCIVDVKFPHGRKIAEIVPIYKCGDPLECSNYRPTSLLSNFSKIFEKLLFHRTKSFLTEHNLLSSKQFGFKIC